MNNLTDCLGEGEAGVMAVEKPEKCLLINRCKTSKRAENEEPEIYKNYCLTRQFGECPKYMESAD